MATESRTLTDTSSDQKFGIVANLGSDSRLSDAGSLAVGRVFQSEIEISVAERTVVLLPSGWHYITP